MFHAFAARQVLLLCSTTLMQSTTKQDTAMSQPTPETNSNTNDIPREVEELVDVIRRLPEEHLSVIEPFLTRVVDSNRRRRRILTLVQDALSQLRLDMKYLAFDLEATRRERDEYRRKLEETA
jgi:hypothetical protein